MFTSPVIAMTLTTGATNASDTTMTRDRRVTSRPTSSATRTWTTTVPGARIRNMETCGCPRELTPTGPPIVMAIGPGFPLGAGPGWTTNLGVTHPSTTAVGCRSAEAGDGYPDRAKGGRDMRRRPGGLSEAEAGWGGKGGGFPWGRGSVMG